MQDTSLCHAGTSPNPPQPHSKTEMAASFVPTREPIPPAHRTEYFHSTKDKDQTKDTCTDKENNQSLVHPNSKSEVEFPESNEDLRRMTTKQTTDIRYSCPICEAVLFSSHDFTIHLRSHNSLLVKDDVKSGSAMLDKGFICTECGKVLGSASSLDRHILVHSGERPFVCRICGLSFTTNGNMHRHVRTHTISEHVDYDSDASSDSLGSPKGLSPSLMNLKRRRFSRTNSEFNNNIVENVLPVASSNDYAIKRKSDSDDLHSNRKKKCESKKSYVEKYDCHRCDKTGFPSSNLLETHIEEFHPECKAKCEPCNLVFKNHRVLNLHRYMVHHAEIKEHFPNSKQETVGFKDLTFVDFSSEKFPHIARIMCEQSLHYASSLHHRFQCDKCGRAFPCGSALNIHRQGCGTENYASSGESCHQDNDLSSSDNEMPTDLSSGGKRDSWGESKVSESSDDVDEERKRSSYFFACLDLQNKSIPITPSQIQPPTNDRIKKDNFFSYNNNNNSEGKDLADIQSIISVTSTGGLLQDLSKSPQPTVLEVTPPDSGSRNGLFESGVTDEEQQDCFAAEFRKMKLRGEFPCRLCSAIFPNLRALKGHNRVHLSSNNGQSSIPYRCNMCPHFSTDKSALIRHMRTHNGDRPYECALCHYAFTTKANCERHLRNRHSKMTREDVKKSIIYHPSEDPTNEMEHKPSRDDVKRSLFGEKEDFKPFEIKECLSENTQNFTKTFVEKSPLTLDTLPLQKPTIHNQINRITYTPDIIKNEQSQIKCSDVGTMTYEENETIQGYQNFTDSPTKSDSDGDTPLDLSMDALDLSKKKNIIQKENKVFKAEVINEDTAPQDLSKKPNTVEDKSIYPLTVEALEKSKSVQCPTPKYPQEDNIPTASPSNIFDNQNPKSPNPEVVPKIDLTKLYPSSINPFFLNNNPTFTAFPGAAVTGPYPPYFIPPPAPILFSANPNQDLIEMKERLQKELIRGLQLTSGGSLVFDQISMASAADRLQALQHQAMTEMNWRMENTKDETQLYPPLTIKETNHPTVIDSDQEYSSQEHVQPKVAEKISQTKPKQDSSSSVKMVIKNGVLIPKQKQRRYRTERPFSCEHCSARFTLRSNMERHIKQQHPQFWTQRQRNGPNIPTKRNNSLSGKMPQTLLNNGQFYPHSGISLYGVKSEDEISRSSSTNDHASENKLNVINDFNKTCISEEVKNAIAQQLKTKFPTSDISQNEEDNDDDLMDEEEDEDLVIDEEAKEDEIEETTAEITEKTEELAIQKRYSMKDENQDLASVSRLLDNASTQTFRQYFHSDEDQQGEDGSEEDEEGLVAAGSTSEGCNSGSDENRSESENNIGANPAAAKKKSAYSLAPNRVSCPYCSRKFPWSSSLRRHVLTHTGQKPYKCSFCPLLFTTKSNCDRHLLRKHGGGTPAPCPDSQTTTHSETSANQNNANNYTMRNVPERPYKCKNCPSSTFSTLSNLKKHLSSKHHLSEKNDGQQSGYESQGSMSEEIDVGESEHCKNNLEIEIKEKPVISDSREIHPGHFVDNVHFYKAHSTLPVMLESNFVPTPASTPASDLPFKCHLCEGSFGDRQEALDHIRDNHCAEFQLLMSKGALEASASADDQQAVDDGGEEGLEQLRGKFPDYANRKVMCAFCLRRFWSAEDLRRHMRTHTGERPFSCDICRRRFTLKHSMLRHRKKHAFPHNPAAEETSPVSDDDTNVPAPSTNHNNNNVVTSAKPWMKARLEEESDLISNLLGIQDKSIVDKMLLSKSADDAAKLLGVKK